METSLKERIISELDNLTPVQQAELLDVARRMQHQSKLPPGTPGEVLIARAHEINFDHDDVSEMMRAIEEDCERIDGGASQN